MIGMRTRRLSAAVLTGVMALGSLGAPTLSALAQTTTTKKHKSFAQRHPNITSAGAGIAAYEVAKKTGRNRARAGGKKNFAQRHPMITGVGAAVLTRKAIKKSENK